MTAKAAEKVVGLWEQLPPAERARIQKELAALNKQEPAQKQKPKNGQFQLKGYVRCELSSADKDAFRGWETARTGADSFGRLVQLVDSGYLLKIGESGQGFQASLCAASTGREWDGYVLTAHASSGERSAALLVFKHDLLMQGDWLAFMQEDGEDFFR